MELFEDLLSAQQKTAEQIETIIRNVKKDSATRKTQGYYQERLQRLESAWLDFESTDNKIRCLSDLPLHHDYFTEQYLRIADITLKYKESFKSEIQKIGIEKPPKPTVTPRTQSDGAIGDMQANHTFNQADVTINQIDQITNKALRNQQALTRVLRRIIDEIKAEEYQNHPESYLQTKIALMSKYMQDLSTNNIALWESTTAGEINGYTLDDFYNFEAEVHNILCTLQQHINTASINTPQNISGNEQYQLHLPKIQIPKFSGSYLQWVPFKDLYIQLIHNTAMSEVQKMFYLTTHLADEPKKLIKHLPISTANYEIAWNILVSRYDNKRLIVTTLLNNLLSHPQIKSETAQALKGIHDLVKECTHGLSAQGLPVDKWDAIITHLILRKLDQSTQTLFEQSLEDNKNLVSLDELLRFIEHRFQALETRGKAIEVGTNRAKITTAAASTANCKVCGSPGHPIYYCDQFLKMTPAGRLQWAQRRKLCVNCLRSDHDAKACTSRFCSKCSKKHNSLLHIETSRKISTSSLGGGTLKRGKTQIFQQLKRRIPQ